ncbi:MAG TPA: hypothetical protein V6D14_11200 [Coleofasciculaceae cyanobacterium]
MPTWKTTRQFLRSLFFYISQTGVTDRDWQEDYKAVSWSDCLIKSFQLF